MDNAAVDQVLAQAYVVLQGVSEDEMHRLSLYECAFMLHSLSNVKECAVLRQRLSDRLCRQLSPSWIDKGDLFEVFSVLVALWEYHVEYVTGEDLTFAVQRLIRSESVVGGPYRSEGGIVDVAANIQIARFTQLAAKPLPGVTAFLEQFLVASCFEGAASPSPYLLYMLAKAYDSPTMTQYVARCHWQAPGHRMAAIAILKKDAGPIAMEETLAVCQSQQQSGWWNGESLSKDVPGSRLATTAFIVGRLANYQQKPVDTVFSPAIRYQHDAVIQTTKQLFTVRTEPLRSSMLHAIDTVCQADSECEITVLAYSFACALKDTTGLSSRQYTALGVASVCGWIAYTIYDDFLDEEGVPAQLPVANVAMRASLDFFRIALPEKNDFQQYVGTVFASMDEANAWELNECRFVIRHGRIVIGKLPSYGKCTRLAARSFAHALGPMAVLASSGQHTSARVRSCDSAFRHYLIARQLHDDMQDWPDDIQAGQASYVVVAILRSMHVQSGTYPLPTLFLAMRQQFRQTTSLHVCRLALRHITQARHYFLKSDFLQPDSGIDTLLNKLEKDIQRSLDQYEKARTFKLYSKPHVF